MRSLAGVVLLMFVFTGAAAGGQTAPPNTTLTEIEDVTVTAPGRSLNISARMEF